jgi:hypothetical protein
VATKEEVGCTLLTIHNIHYMMSLMASVRLALREHRYPQFIADFLHLHFPKLDYPGWVVEALTLCGFASCVADHVPGAVEKPREAPSTHNFQTPREKSEGAARG